MVTTLVNSLPTFGYVALTAFVVGFFWAAGNWCWNKVVTR